MQETPKWKIVLMKIWPTVYRIINGFLYFILSTVKSIVTYSIKQLKGTL